MPFIYDKKNNKKTNKKNFTQSWSRLGALRTANQDFFLPSNV